ncbi:hypothetical protein BGW80DRAFT_1287386 [Lactifluus volemus]|nr:hypothetical protein BGW80DRAFT_1287386 [Lactifluus volemus]
MLSTPGASQRPQRPSIQINPFTPLSDLYSDARLHGYQGSTRTVRFPGAAASSGGSIAKSEDGERCVVAGKESLRILRVSDSQTSLNPDHKFSLGRGGHRIDASRNLWTGSGLKMESTSTDVAWGRGSYDNKILTSARNGELIVWDLNKLGPSKYERRIRLHFRSIHVLAYSPIVANYCMTGSADGDIRVWDLRDMRNSVIRLHHPTSVRTAAFSCSQACPVHAVVGLDNGSLYRYDFSMGSKGQLDRLPVAHSGPILALDWCSPEGGGPSAGGWIASGSMDWTVKVWDLTGPHIERTPIYTLATQFPVRRVRWRPGYECELAIVSNAEFGAGSISDVSASGSVADVEFEKPEVAPVKRRTDIGDPVEIWDVRRGYIAKWLVGGSAIEGGVTDVEFRDSHALWTQHSSGTFAQLDLRYSYRPLDAVPRHAASWTISDTLAFVVDRKSMWEVPYDDLDPKARQPGPTPRMKALGDKPFKPIVQSVGTHVFDPSHQGSDRFCVLAKGYVFDGSDKMKLCENNAQIALQVEHRQVFQMWCLLRSLFTPTPTSPDTSRPTTPPLSPLPLSSRILPHSHSVSPAVPGSTHSVSPSVLHPSLDTQRSDSISTSHSSYPASVDSPYPVASASSSNSPSPQRVSSATQVTTSPLSVLSTPSTTSPRSPSLFPRHPSSSAFFPNRARGLASFRRLSVSTPSPSSDNNSSPSLRHIGEGTLDDSDSGSESDISSLPSASALSPTAQAHGRTAPSIPQAHPSPLSRVAAASQQMWTEDEREVDDDSPSPASSETDSDGATAPKRIRARSLSLRRRAATRGRSSTTVVSPNPELTVAALERPGSRSSMRTVTAHDDADYEHVAPSAPQTGTPRVASAGMSDGLFGSSTDPHHANSLALATQDVYVRNSVRRRVEEVKEAIRGALLEALEEYAEVGDVQTCAMMALIASTELQIGQQRAQMFVEAYIELLMRTRLHTTAAYLRKNSVLPDIRAVTNLQTTVYMSCGRCGKPILAQQVGSMCANCKSPAARCSICHLPVKSMLFHCTVCSHGGHQACYRRFYAEMPLVVLPTPHPPSPASPLIKQPVPPPPDRSASRSKDRGGDDVADIALDHSFDASTIVPPTPRPLMGHSCAAGCGHICWVANFRDDAEKV